MQSIDILIRETKPDGSSRVSTRWAHWTKEKGWTSATASGQEHREHRDEASARRALAGWLRSQAMLISPDDQTVEAVPLSEVAAVSEECKPPPPSSAGLEDLL